MKLLFDENISPKLVAALQDEFPDSEHVFNAGLGAAPDGDIWKYAESRGLAIVTKDHDFEALSALQGAPPKLILLALGNTSTQQIEKAIRDSAESIRLFGENAAGSCLVIQAMAAVTAKAEPIHK